FENQAISLTSAAISDLEGDFKLMAQHWEKVLKIPLADIGLNSHFIFDLGGDSLGLIDLLNQLEKTSGKLLDPDIIRKRLTLKEMTEYFQTLD
ncbi:MAG: acyl carrier protein, partial [Eubacteriaceae bacterium]|nr:acyl carrier protein [Eubacteriaceae bacterium]